MILGILVILILVFSYILSGILVKPFRRSPAPLRS